MTFAYTSFDEQNFLKNIIKTYLQDGTEHCWLWKGSKNTNGYGYFSNSSNTEFAHRFSIQYHGKTIKEGFVVNHVCEIRCCVNPKHLNIITQKENLVLRGNQELVCNNIIDYSIQKTKYEQCVERLGDSFSLIRLDKTGLEIIFDMINIRLLLNKNNFNRSLDSEQEINGYKRKYFWYLDEILKQYDLSYDDILNPKEKNGPA